MFLAAYLAYSLALFYLTYFLAVYLAFVLGILSAVYPGIIFYLTYTLAVYLDKNGILSGIHSCTQPT